MKNKKGFTLIELLAVIVIIAIIALIATPIILNMITKARKNAARSSALGYIDAVEYNNGFASIGTEGYTSIIGENIDVTEIDVKIKGQKPTSGTITVDNNGKVTNATNLCINGYLVNYDGQDATVGSKCGSSDEEVVNYKQYNVKERIYFDPVNYEICDSATSNSNTCYIWIVISKDNNKYELFLPKQYNNMKWTQKNPVDDIKSFTSTWSNKLTIDSKYDIKVSDNYAYNFSETKARMITKEEIEKSDVLSSIECSGTSCLVLNTTSNMFSNIYDNSINNLFPYSVNENGTFIDGFIIHPVITLDLTKGVGNSTAVDGDGGTLIDASTNDTHKGIVYIDPINVNSTCNQSNSLTSTGNVKGCLKFYIFDDSGDTYKMILDHNTSGNVAWNSSGNNTNGMKEVNDRLKEDTTGWKGNPRLISADEVAHIVGADTAINWSSNTAAMNEYFILDGSGTNISGWKESPLNLTVKSKYYWLYDYTYNCEGIGCKKEDNNKYPYGTKDSTNTENIYGYWTSSKVNNSTKYSWGVSSVGNVIDSGVDGYGYGVRPVIEIEKSVLQ